MGPEWRTFFFLALEHSLIKTVEAFCDQRVACLYMHTFFLFYNVRNNNPGHQVNPLSVILDRTTYFIEKRSSQLWVDPTRTARCFTSLMFMSNSFSLNRMYHHYTSVSQIKTHCVFLFVWGFKGCCSNTLQGSLWSTHTWKFGSSMLSTYVHTSAGCKVVRLGPKWTEPFRGNYCHLQLTF